MFLRTPQIFWRFLTFSANSIVCDNLVTGFCPIFTPWYNDPETLPHQITLICPIGGDVRHLKISPISPAGLMVMMGMADDALDFLAWSSGKDCKAMCNTGNSNPLSAIRMCRGRGG